MEIVDKKRKENKNKVLTYSSLLYQTGMQEPIQFWILNSCEHVVYLLLIEALLRIIALMQLALLSTFMRCAAAQACAIGRVPLWIFNKKLMHRSLSDGKPQIQISSCRCGLTSATRCIRLDVVVPTKCWMFSRYNEWNLSVNAKWSTCKTFVTEIKLTSLSWLSMAANMAAATDLLSDDNGCHKQGQQSLRISCSSCRRMNLFAFHQTHERKETIISFSWYNSYVQS